MFYNNTASLSYSDSERRTNNRFTLTASLLTSYMISCFRDQTDEIDFLL